MISDERVTEYIERARRHVEVGRLLIKRQKGVKRRVPEMTICGTLVAVGSLTARRARDRGEGRKRAYASPAGDFLATQNRNLAHSTIF